MDIQLIDGGSVVGFFPLTETGMAWLTDNTQAEGWQWLGNVLYVEHRLAADIIEGAGNDGISFAP
jgi:hypothetical protein